MKIKYLLISIVFAFLVLPVQDIFANGELYNSTNQSSSGLELWSVNNSATSTLAPGFRVDNSGTLTSVTIMLSGTGGNAGVTTTVSSAVLGLFYAASTSTMDSNIENNFDYYLIATSSAGFNVFKDASTTVTFDFPNTPVYTNFYYVLVGLGSTGTITTGPTGINLRGNNLITGGSYNDADLFRTDTGWLQAPAEYYIQINENSGDLGNTYSGNQISWVFPTNGSATDNFGNWIVGVTTTWHNTGVKISYGRTSGVYTYSDYEPLGPSSGMYPAKHLTKLNQIASGTVFATAYLINSNCTGGPSGNCETLIRAQTNEISFTLNNTSTPFFGNEYDFSGNYLGFGPGGALGGSLPKCGTLDFWGNIKTCSVEAIGEIVRVFILDTSTSSQVFFGQSLNNFQSVFPFNVFFDFHETAYAALATQSTSTVGLNFPLFITTSTVPILGASSTSGLVGESNFTTLMTFEKNAIWLAAGIAMIVMIF